MCKWKYNIYPLHKCKPKLIRQIMIKKISVNPICEKFWQKKYPNYDFNWKYIWTNAPNIIKEARLISLNWKILSNIYPTNILLHKIGKSPSSNCIQCNEKDYLEHFFYHCKIISMIWVEAASIISNKLGKSTKLSVTDVLFGYNNDNNENNRYVNIIIMVGKMCISKFKYGKHPNLVFLFNQELQFREIIKM